jgi:putative peptidoglycan lipid II flippase
MLKSSGAMGAATLTSRVLGMVREMVYARFMADGWVAGAFTLAFMIPNLFRRLLGEGALTAAFVPLFKEKERTACEDEMWRLANAVISALVVIAAGIVALVVAGVSVALWAGEFRGQTRLMLELLRVMFPYMPLVCLTAVFVGMLNARGHFFIPAMGTTLLNVVMIASVLVLAPRVGTTLPEQVFALAIGVLIAGVCQAGFQLPVLFREGFRYRWVSPWQDENVRTVARRMIPGTLGVAAFQLNVLLTQSIAFWFDTVSAPVVAPFNYAVRLMELPQGVFGVSLATFLLPTLSGLAAEKKFPEFRATLSQALGYLLYVNLLASVLLVALAEPMVRLLFEWGKFTDESTRRVAFALACLAPGLVAFSSVNVLARAFYALGDVKTPMRISMVCLGLNVVFTLFLVPAFRQGGMGIANTMTSCFNVYLLLHALRRKMPKLELAPLQRTAAALLPIAAAAGALAWGVATVWERSLGSAAVAARLGAVLVPMALATAVYGGVSCWVRVPEARDLLGLVLRRWQRTPG